MSEKNSAMLKTPYTTQYVSHVVSSSLLELSMALMLWQERGRAPLLQSCYQGGHLLPQASKPWSKAAPSWDRARFQRFQEGLKNFPTITACALARETLS